MGLLGIQLGARIDPLPPTLKNAFQRFPPISVRSAKGTTHFTLPLLIPDNTRSPARGYSQITCICTARFTSNVAESFTGALR